MKTPIHLWIVGILSLIWNAYGCYIYVMAASKNPAYMETLTPEAVTAYEAMPGFYFALFAIAVWSALIGSILLLLRKSLAVPVFMVSLASMALSYIYAFFIADIDVKMTTAEIVTTVIVVVAAVFLLGYSRAMARAGVLR